MERTLAPEIVARVCGHMNDDHADSVLAYARHFGKLTDASAARMQSIDARGMLLEVTTPGGVRLERIAFDREIADATEARETLVAMARAAGIGAGEEH